MSSALNFIFDVNSDSEGALFIGYNSTATKQVAQQVRDDSHLELTIQPITVNQDGSYTRFSPDYETGDTFQVGIGTADGQATSGTFKLTAGATTTGLTTLAYNITAASLQTPLSAAFQAEGKAACTVTALASGAFQIRGNSNGSIATGFLAVDAANLFPDCDGFVEEQSLGDGSSPYDLLLVLRTAPIAYATPDTVLPAASVDIVEIQVGDATHDEILGIEFPADNTYAGTFSVGATASGTEATCGVADFTMTATDLGLLLANHPDIYYQNSAGIADNVVVTKQNSTFRVQFTGTLGGAATVSLEATNIDLIAGQGVSGFIDLNTISLYNDSLTVASQTFTRQISIVRTRATGERRTIYGPTDITISKDVIDFESMVPTPRPDYLTITEGDARYLSSDGSGDVEFASVEAIQFRVKDDSSDFYIAIAVPDASLTANNSLTIDTQDASRNLTIPGDATISGTNTGDQTTISGNAATATALQTARTINGTSFNGTANITVAAAGSTLTGTSLASGIVTSSLTTLGTLTSLAVTSAAGTTAATLTGGTQTASFPVINATQTWNNGAVQFTGFKLNVTSTASSGTSLLMDLQVGGSTVFRVDKFGTAYSGSVDIGGGGYHLDKSGSTLAFTANFAVALTLSSTGASVPGTLAVTGITTHGAPVRLKNYTVATLPAGTQGDTAFVTDALAPTFLATVVGGGAIVTTVFYNGTNWVAQ